jgi:hypothetical protein
MSSNFERFLARETIASAALNAGMNAALATWQWANAGPLSAAAIALDLTTTPIFIAFLSTLFGTTGARRKLKASRMALPSWLPGSTFFAALPVGVVARSLVLAAIAALVCAWPLFALVGTAGSDALTLGQGVAAKVATTIVFSLMIVPVGLLAAAGDVVASRRHAIA